MSSFRTCFFALYLISCCSIFNDRLSVALGDSLHIISHLSPFVNTFLKVFFTFFSFLPYLQLLPALFTLVLGIFYNETTLYFTFHRFHSVIFLKNFLKFIFATRTFSLSFSKNQTFLYRFYVNLFFEIPLDTVLILVYNIKLLILNQRVEAHVAISSLFANGSKPLNM